MRDRWLFAYGTLQDADILSEVLGAIAAARLTGAPSIIADARLIRSPHGDYPILLRRPGGFVPGLLLRGLTVRDFRRLDRYEGREYRRTRLKLRVGARRLSAFVYVPRRRPAPGPTWNLDAWRQRRAASCVRE